jgi:hypothetical protein
MPDETAEPARPLLTVVRGEPTPEQLAALIAVVAARASGDGDASSDAPAAPSLWASPQLRTPLAAGPGAWLASGLPLR